MEFALARPASGVPANWIDLADRAITPPGLARPELAAAAFAQHPSARLATIAQRGRLLAALPVEKGRVATSHLSNAGYPLLDSQFGKEALAALLSRLKQPILISGLPASGSLWEAIAAASTHHANLANWQRAALRVHGEYVDWFDGNFDRKRRSRYRRNLHDLAQLPDFRFERLRQGDDIAPWIAAFLELEARGWKGQRGTALANVQGVTEAFARGVHLLHEHDRLRFWRMQTSTGPVAMVLAIVERRTASFSKITYDETRARLSPGAMIILESTRDLFEEGSVDLIDSCAIPDHPLLDNIWRDRLPVCDMLVAGPGLSATAFAWKLKELRWRRKARGAVRDLYLRISGRRRS